VSTTGLYVVTEERWYPGTLVLMTLQIMNGVEEAEERSIVVHSRAVRWGNDGVGLQFVLAKNQETMDSAGPMVKSADRKELDRFLNRLRKTRR
jgi:Tfp pilus assembly protein PilZ